MKAAPEVNTDSDAGSFLTSSIMASTSASDGAAAEVKGAGSPMAALTTSAGAGSAAFGATRCHSSAGVSVRVTTGSLVGADSSTGGVVRAGCAPLAPTRLPNDAGEVPLSD